MNLESILMCSVVIMRVLIGGFGMYLQMVGYRLVLACTSAMIPDRKGLVVWVFTLRGN